MTNYLDKRPGWVNGQWVKPLYMSPAPLGLYLENTRRLIRSEQSRVISFLGNAFGYSLDPFPDEAILVGRQKDPNSQILYVRGKQRFKKHPGGKEHMVTVAVVANSLPGKTKTGEYLEATWYLDMLVYLLGAPNTREFIRRAKLENETDDDYENYLATLPQPEMEITTGEAEVADLTNQRGVPLALVMEFSSIWGTNI